MTLSFNAHAAIARAKLLDRRQQYLTLGNPQADRARLGVLLELQLDARHAADVVDEGLSTLAREGGDGVAVSRDNLGLAVGLLELRLGPPGLVGVDISLDVIEVESTAAGLLLLDAREVVRARVGGLRSVGEGEEERAGAGPIRRGGEGEEGVVRRCDDGGSDVTVWMSCVFTRDWDDQFRLNERARGEDLGALLGGAGGGWGGNSSAGSGAGDTLNAIYDLLVVESRVGVLAECGAGGQWRRRDGGAGRAWSSACACWDGCGAGANGAGGRGASIPGAGHGDGYAAGGILLALRKDLVSTLLARSLRWAGPEVVALIDEEVAIATNDELVLRADALGALEALGGLGDDTGVSEGVVELALVGGVDAVCAVRVIAEDTVLADGVLLDDVRA